MLLKDTLAKQRAQAQAVADQQAAQYSQQYSYQHAQQVQMGSASAGSGWTGANMECDCGEDTCPRCNLMLSMDGGGYWIGVVHNLRSEPKKWDTFDAF